MSDPKNAFARVHSALAALGCGHLDVKCRGPHILIGVGRHDIARVTDLGHDNFGLSFRGATGAWEMLVIDALEDVVEDVAAAIPVAA